LTLSTVSAPLRVRFARLCRETRLNLDVSQGELAAAATVSRSLIAAIESERANPTLAVVERIAVALGIDLDFASRPPLIIGSDRQRDLVHAKCSGFVGRRFAGDGWDRHREVTIVRGRAYGWIDVLAFHPTTRVLIIVEVKTRIDDLGAIERQLGWYERSAADLAASFGWRPAKVLSWLVVLATHEVERSIIANRDAFHTSFPARAPAMRAVVRGDDIAIPTRGIALIDPRSRRRDWLLPSRSDGRRSTTPYLDYADAARRFWPRPEGVGLVSPGNRNRTGSR
jgi:transcriptional regulator with XRE-family HTH domain